MAAGADFGWAETADGLCIAYEVRGDGPVDLVVVPGMLTTLMAPLVSRSLAMADEELARFTRLIKLDKRGTGLSDRVVGSTTPTVEERIDDIRAVMDAAGSERACVMALADGGPVAMVFAATYPDRVSSLVLDTTSPRVRWAPDWPWGIRDEERTSMRATVKHRWGFGVMADQFGVVNEEARRELAMLERLAGTPAEIDSMTVALAETDVRPALPSIAAPVLVLHHDGRELWPIEAAHYLAEHLADARLVELPTRRSDAPFDREGWLPAIEEFLTGAPPSARTDRVLKTVLFTDIVGSTEHASRLGDRDWRSLLDRHDRAIRDALVRHRGEEINTTGDGFFAAFDGPARAIRCAQEISREGQQLGIQVRAGMHTGECERRGDDLAGIAVHICARVASLADGNEVLVTGTVRDLVAGSGIEFDDRGRRQLKGVPGEWDVLAVR